ncbi:MBL fold metallo-hydrolase [Methanospirillum lacunae]|uniref:MBL fold metallo-hydrolase n=1 Tax=Methanospirillum lacunae TaxID=668570 RepID=A0A2V2N5V3_9EURY|nr:MBL fold metallo-hydrolase [Methanospirillum lacunae]PWR70891.1 MBL fold metallo-hydrolase [Methanospirillum lacunae]
MRLQEIDRAEITVLVDNYTDLLRSDSSSVVKRPPLSNGEVLLAEHGLSLYITTWSGNESISILMDAGASKISLQYNANQLGISLKDIAALVISHGHDDHVGSLIEVLECAGRPVPVYVHPGSFSRRQKRFSNEPFIDIAPPDLNACRNAGAELLFTSGPTMFWHDRILITGDIERTTEFEQSNPVYYVEDSDSWVPDEFHDDQAIILNLKEKGLVIITGCAHAGVINTIRYARMITGMDQIYAVIGGFHLSGSFFSRIINPTVAAMKEIDPEYVIPLHCTGWEAITQLTEEMPNQVILNTVGSTYQFG